MRNWSRVIGKAVGIPADGMVPVASLGLLNSALGRHREAVSDSYEEGTDNEWVAISCGGFSRFPHERSVPPPEQRMYGLDIWSIEGGFGLWNGFIAHLSPGDGFVFSDLHLSQPSSMFHSRSVGSANEFLRSPAEIEGDFGCLS